MIGDAAGGDVLALNDKPIAAPGNNVHVVTLDLP